MRHLFACLLFATACSSAYADQPVGPQPPGPQIAIGIAPEKSRAPYDVQVVTERGETAPTYQLKDRFYVQGNLNERYIIRVTNPTARRVEAVVSVDGLDVVDGENGDLRKRGYIVPAWGEVRIEGFRTSLSDVATFRFSSVDGSYAGKKGKARNVGVIAVAIFEEQAQAEQQIIVGDTRPQYRDRGGWDEAEESADAAPRDGGRRVSRADNAKAERKRAEPEAPAATGTAGGYGGGQASRPSVAPRPRPDFDDDGDMYQPPPPPPGGNPAPRTNRAGLGTEFGEQRSSAASFTKFVRANNRPIAIAELRYNDAQGLMALGINVGPMPDAGEIMVRETADPFPGDNFARRPD